MNNRGEQPRARGHAAFAQQARRALGVTTEVHGLGDVPLPIMHTALGIAACALTFLVRVPALGLRNGIIASFAVAAATAAVLFAYDRAVYAAEVRPGADSTVLPVAAVGAFAIVLAASTSWWIRLGSGALTALIIGGVPHIAELEIARRRTAPLRLGRDIAGLMVCIPYLSAAVADDTLPQWFRVILVAVGLGLVAFDGLRIDGVPVRLTLGGAAACAVAIGVASVLATGGPGVRAAMMLIVWYGVRGAAASLGAGRRGVLLILEYVGLVVAALLALAWAGTGR